MQLLGSLIRASGTITNFLPWSSRADDARNLSAGKEDTDSTTKSSNALSLAPSDNATAYTDEDFDAYFRKTENNGASTGNSEKPARPRCTTAKANIVVGYHHIIVRPVTVITAAVVTPSVATNPRTRCVSRKFTLKIKTPTMETVIEEPTAPVELPPAKCTESTLASTTDTPVDLAMDAKAALLDRSVTSAFFDTERPTTNRNVERSLPSKLAGSSDFNAQETHRTSTYPLLSEYDVLQKAFEDRCSILRTQILAHSSAVTIQQASTASSAIPTLRPITHPIDEENRGHIGASLNRNAPPFVPVLAKSISAPCFIPSKQVMSSLSTSPTTAKMPRDPFTNASNTGWFVPAQEIKTTPVKITAPPQRQSRRRVSKVPMPSDGNGPTSTTVQPTIDLSLRQYTSQTNSGSSTLNGSARPFIPKLSIRG